MRKKRLIPYFNNSQKIRVFVDGIGLYMTIGQLETMFATTNHRVATWTALETLGLDRMKDPNISGIGTSVKIYDNALQSKLMHVQLDLL